jgi:hypothetical protein
MQVHYDHTARALSAIAGCSAAYVLQLAREGKIPHITATDGTMLFKRTIVKKVQTVKAQRQALRGRYVRKPRLN